MTAVMLTPEGSVRSIRIRSARADDDVALASMFGRCSRQTRYRRFHGFLTRLPDAYLRQRLAGDPAAHHAIVAELITATGASRLVGLAGATPLRDVPHVREAAALVEDEWQLRGLGRRLAAELVAHAREAGVELIRMPLCQERPRLLRYVISCSHVVSTRGSGCDMTVEIAVPATGADPFRRGGSPAAETAP